VLSLFDLWEDGVKNTDDDDDDDDGEEGEEDEKMGSYFDRFVVVGDFSGNHVDDLIASLLLGDSI